MQGQIEQTLDSREVAEMIEKEHKKLLRDIRRYEQQFIEAKIGLNDFFIKSEYKDSINRTLPCYRITKKGCEFIAHKLTGTKGTIFTAKYINRFHEMQEIIQQHKLEPKLPWFIRRFRGKYVVLWRDFIEITGYDIYNRKPHNWQRIRPGADFNGWGWKCDNDEFKEEYGFDYGTDPCLMYFYPDAVMGALHLILEENKVRLKPGAYKMLEEGVHMLHKSGKRKAIPLNSCSGANIIKKDEVPSVTTENLSICINIVSGQESMRRERIIL